jgi:hypothetical protein
MMQLRGKIEDRMHDVVELARSISGRLRRSRRWSRLEKDAEIMPDGAECWHNDVYSVTVRRNPSGWAFFGGPWVQIGISCQDGEARHDWRDFQKIKNDICGDDWEAIELYPRESRLLDPSNYYMLWCAPDIPIGKFEGRVICDAHDCIAPQRGFWRP